MAGAVGGLLIFFSSLIAVVISGLVTLSYAAHGYLAIVEDTAAGSDDVRWPDEAITEFLWKPFYLAWVWAVPVVATWLVVMAAAPDLFHGPLGNLVTIGGSLWLLFPISMLSSLGGRSRVQVLHMGLLARLVRHAGVLMLFYLLTGPVLAVGLALAYLGLFHSGWILLPAVPACVALFFIHARLLGRLGWRISQGATRKKAGKKKPPRRIKATASNDPWAVPDGPESTEDEDMADVPAESSTQIAAGDPRALPGPHALKAGPPPMPADEEEDEWNPRKKPYALADDATAWPESERAAERDIAPDDVVAAEPAPADVVRQPEVLFPADPRYLAPPEPPAPRFVLFTNVWNFPVLGNSLRPFVSLTLLGLLLGFFLRLMLMHRPP